MGLTTGTGPFGHMPSGRLNFDPPERFVLVEPLGRRVRAFAGDRLLVDSERAVLVHETGRLPRYAFPEADVFAAGEPEAEAEGFVRVPWSAADRWLEEEDEIVVHPRDPYHRIEVLRSARRVVVRVRGELLAESRRPRILFETGLPARYYLPADDVRLERLQPLEIRTGCAYKGYARYWDVVTESGRAAAAVWSYPEPLREGEPVRDLLCFFQERAEIDVEVDGVPAESPRTPWSTIDWISADWVFTTAHA